MACCLFVAVVGTVTASEACTSVLFIAPAIWFLSKQAKNQVFWANYMTKINLSVFSIMFSLSPLLVPKYHQSVPHLL